MRTVDLSGMGGGYENECQLMLQAGEKWLEENKPKDLKARTFEGIYGILEPASAETEQLSQYITKDRDCTGAMHQCVMGHLIYIAKEGKEKWFKLFDDQPERFFEWDETEASCPTTELSERMAKDKS